MDNMSVADPSPTRTSIVEANKHLELLYSRVEDLENDLHIRLESERSLKSNFDKDKQNLHMNVKKLKAESAAKDSELKDLRKLLEASNKKVDEYRRLIEVKDGIIDNLKDKCKHMASILSYQPMLQNLISTMSKVQLLEQPVRSKNGRPKHKKSEVNPENISNGLPHDDQSLSPSLDKINAIESFKSVNEVNCHGYEADNDSPLNPANHKELYL